MAKPWKGKKPYTIKSKEEGIAAAEKEIKQRADYFIEALQNGTAGIGRTAPWDPNLAIKRLPYNAKTGKTYRGGNSLILETQHAYLIATGVIPPTNNDPRWMTYNQAQEVGCQVIKGAKGSVTIYSPIVEKKPGEAPSEKSKAVAGSAKTKTPSESVLDPLEKGKSKVCMVSARVFHASQIEGLPPLEAEPKVSVDERLKAAQEIVDKSGALVVYGHSKAAYSVANDFIKMPPSESFESPARGMAVKLHELAHWTGAKSRLDRPFSAAFGSPEYAKEELRAELGSYAIAQRLGYGGLYDPSHHTGYVQSWVKVLQDTPGELMAASRDVDKILEFLKVPLPTYEPMPLVEKAPKAEVAAKPKGPGSDQRAPQETPSVRPSPQMWGPSVEF